VGIGDNFPKGRQVDFVLGKFSDSDLATINEKADTACEIVKSFTTIGIERTMNYFNKK
jgi:PTH1 family peptidyl-tRNA hydrolase